MDDLQKFDRLSKQRIDYTPLSGGGYRARITITLPDGKARTFVEEVSAKEVQNYESEIAGVEIGYAIGEIVSVNGAWTGSIVEVGFLGSIIKTIGKGVKAIGSVAKKIVTSKVMQTAAKGLAIAAPMLGPLAPTALAVAGGIGVAGKLLSAKTAQSVGATRTASAITHQAIADAKRVTPSQSAMKGLLGIAMSKSNKAFGLATGKPATAQLANIRAAVQRGAASKAAPGGDMLAFARAGRIRSSQGGTVTPAQLEAARAQGRVFFVAA